MHRFLFIVFATSLVWAAPITDIPTSVLTIDLINLVRNRLIEGAQARYAKPTSFDRKS
jgi:hypothetical protein